MKKLGDKCKNCNHYRMDHSFFVGLCAHVFDNPGKKCGCKRFIEKEEK